MCGYWALMRRYCCIIGVCPASSLLAKALLSFCFTARIPIPARSRDCPRWTPSPADRVARMLPAQRCRTALMTENDAVARLTAEYSAKARVYHRIWAPVLASMALPLIRRLPLTRAAQVLDLGTGSGILVPALRAAAPDAWLLGVDRAEGMLHLARRVVPCAAMDAQRLALRSQSFDVVLLAYVLFHCPEPLAALREVHRVLRDAGTIGVVNWGSAVMPGAEIWTEELDAA